MEVLYLRTGKDEADRSRLRAELYRPVMGTPRSTRGRLDTETAMRMVRELELHDSELGAG